MKKSSLLSLLLIVFLAGCGQFGPPPETPTQTLAVIDRQFTAVVQTATDLRKKGVLTDAQTEQIDTLIQRGNRLLDTAWELQDVGAADRLDKKVDELQDVILKIEDHIKEARSNG